MRPDLLFLGGAFPQPVALVSSGVNVPNITDSYNTGAGDAGADPTGVLDSSDAIQHYLDATLGGTIYCPPGVYRLKNRALTFTNKGTLLWMDGAACAFKVDDSGAISGHDAFTCQDLRGCGIIGGGLISAFAQRASNYMVNIKGGDASVEIPTTTIAASQFQLDVDLDNYFSGVLVSDSTVGNWASTIGTPARRAIWTNGANGGDGILWNSPKGASHAAFNIFVSTASIGTGNAGFRLQGSGDLRLFQCDSLGPKRGFLLDNVNPIAQGGGGVCNVKLTACEFDNTGAAVDSDCIRLVPGDITQPINIEASDLWCSSGYNGIKAVGFSGNFCSFAIANGTIAGQNQYGVRGVSPVSTANIVVGDSVYFGRGAQANALGNTNFT